MKLFQVISEASTVPLFFEKTGRKLNILISYAYQEGGLSLLTGQYRHMIEDLYLDSGAFSVFTGSRKISRTEYGLFLKKYGDLFTERFSLDDRFDDAYHNLQNQLELEEALKDKPWKPIPVVHDDHDPYGEFEMYVQRGHQYVALGSMGARKKIPLDVLGRIRENYPAIRVHMFGTLNLEMLEQYHPYSADSAGWAHQAGHGAVYFWRESENKDYCFKIGGVESDSRNKRHIKRSPFYEEIEQFWAERFGFTYDDLVSDATNRFILNLYFFLQAQDYLNGLEQPHCGSQEG